MALAARELLALPGLWTSALVAPVTVDGSGRGQPVIAIPGMLAGDRSMVFMRRSLAASGFDARKSGIGFHAVATPRSVDMVQRELANVHAETGRKVALLGWSLGGLYARYIAGMDADRVSAVVTLGAPFAGNPRHNNAWRLYELLSNDRIENAPFDFDRLAAKPPVPTLAVWSPIDGVISEENARGGPTQSDRQLEVQAKHLDIATRPQAVRQIITALGELI